jgi:hypothetical protein
LTVQLGSNAKVEAFLGVKLFAKVYEQFKGTSLPPESGLKNLTTRMYQLLVPRSRHQAARHSLESGVDPAVLTAIDSV